MEKIKLMTLTALFVSSLTYSAIIERDYFFSAPEAKSSATSDGYDLIHISGTMNTAPAGEPAVPYHAVSLLLPPGEKAEKIETERSGKVVLEGKFNIYPQQNSQPYSKGRSGVFVKNEDVYASDSAYPAVPYGELSTHYLHGHSFALSAFTPAEYIPVTGELSIYEKVTVRITTSPCERSAAALKNLRISDEIRKKILSSDQAKGNTLSSYSYPKPAAESYDYLILTADAYKRNFDSLINFYNGRGIRTKVMSAATVYGEMTGRDNQEKLRNYIIQEYQNSGISFVLLAGDVELIPARGFYCSVQSSSVYTDDNIPSDLYYSALDGTWNDDDDNLWGEIGEDDLLPELSVTRFSFSNSTELASMINKTLKYQSEPVTGELRNPLMVGEKLWDDPETWGADYLELLIGYHEDNGYTTSGIPEDHNITRMYDKNSVWTKSQLISEMNKGQSFIHHDGHSNYTYNMRMSNSDITNSNFNSLNGVTHNFTIISSSGCMSGGYDYNDCIGERFTAIDNLAAAYIGNSRYGWFNEGQTEGPSIHLHREFTDALYRYRTSEIGTAHRDSKIDTAPWVNAPGQWEEGALRWCFYDCNVLGDPAMNIWTDEPEVITANYPEAIVIGQTDYELDIKGTAGQPLLNIVCALFQGATLIGTAKTDDLGNATIALDTYLMTTGSAELVVSGYNTLKHTYPVEIIENTGKYIVIDSYSINSGGDELIEYGESALMSVTLKNIGQTDASDITMVLALDDSYVLLTADSAYAGNLPAGNTLLLENAFAFSIAAGVPDLYRFGLNSTIKDSEEQWKKTISLTAYSAVLSMKSFAVFDGDNSVLDPGETADVIVAVTNTGHAAASGLNGTLVSSDERITVNTTDDFISEILPGSVGYMSFSVSAGSKASDGYVAEFCFSAAGDKDISTENTFLMKIGAQIEDFETGDFSAFNWYFEGNAPWTIEQSSVYEGVYSARSGSITDDQATALVISDEVLMDGNISFYIKTSSEGYFDPLIFYIDGIELKRWSYGLMENWEFYSAPVTKGEHIFKWVFLKDEMESAGEDCVWLDMITFPGILNPSGIDSEQNNLPAITELYQNYPNPFNPETVISYAAKEPGKAVISVYNIKGEEIFKHTSNNTQPGKYSVNFSADNINSGVYFYNLELNGKFIGTKRMLLIK